MQDRPTATELLQTIAELLEREVLPAVQGPLQHQVRVAGNLTRILEREQQLGGQAAARARQRLKELLGSSSDTLSELYPELVARLGAGPDETFERRAWQVLVDITRQKLAIVKPGHDAYDFGPETTGT